MPAPTAGWGVKRRRDNEDSALGRPQATRIPATAIPSRLQLVPIEDVAAEDVPPPRGHQSNGEFSTESIEGSIYALVQTCLSAARSVNGAEGEIIAAEQLRQFIHESLLPSLTAVATRRPQRAPEYMPKRDVADLPLDEDDFDVGGPARGQQLRRAHRPNQQPVFPLGTAVEVWTDAWWPARIVSSPASKPGTYTVAWAEAGWEPSTDVSPILIRRY
eukprot:TRINITY_DN4454_c0_g1_i1.p1 TRINITY_DN4454_c0_g1~~TRINITY_DN4454_c0_g1_i1.p1  ORF type:complete len:249 (+),score=52.04 TRINITY_DN4454_c0_g1_i1:97-747(+)